jgi:hypothetical protein
VESRRESAVEADVKELARALEQEFAALAPWLALEDPLWSKRPRSEAWSPREVLEHVVLMQRYVLLLVDKLGQRSLRRSAAAATLPERLDPAAELEALARVERRWEHPAHMTPSGTLGREALAAELDEQRRRCRQWLERLPRGEGALHSIRMSVVARKLDLYGWLRLVQQHLARHRAQLERTYSMLTGSASGGPSGPAPGAP